MCACKGETNLEKKIERKINRKNRQIRQTNIKRTNTEKKQGGTRTTWLSQLDRETLKQIQRDADRKTDLLSEAVRNSVDVSSL